MFHDSLRASNKRGEVDQPFPPPPPPILRTIRNSRRGWSSRPARGPVSRRKRIKFRAGPINRGEPLATGNSESLISAEMDIGLHALLRIPPRRVSSSVSVPVSPCALRVCQISLPSYSDYQPKRRALVYFWPGITFLSLSLLPFHSLRHRGRFTWSLTDFSFFFFSSSTMTRRGLPSLPSPPLLV